MSGLSSVKEQDINLKNIVNDIYSLYSFAGQSVDYHYAEIVNILGCGEDILNNGELNKKGCLEEIIHNYFVEFVHDRLNCFSDYTIVENYINSNLKHQKKYHDLVNELEKLNSFFEKFKYVPSPDLCHLLIDNNLIIKQMLDEIVTKNIKLFQTNSLDSIFDNATIELLVETYCVSHNIKIFDSEEAEIILQTTNKNNKFNDCGDLTSDKMFFYEINKIPRLTPIEERELLVKFSENRSRKIRDILVERNMKLVAKIASRYINNGLDLMDLIQEGSIGLVEAIEKFDVSKGVKLSTYATCWIRQAMGRALADKGRNIRLPVHITEKVASYERTVERLCKELNRAPSLMEVAKSMNTSKESLEKLLRNTKNTFSINMLIDCENTTELEDFLIDDGSCFEEDVEKRELPEQIRTLFLNVNLNEREIDILTRRFGLNGDEPQTLESIGKIHGVCRERIRQVEQKALKKLRQTSHIRNFAAFADNPDIVNKNRILGGQNIDEEEIGKEMRALTIYFNKNNCNVRDTKFNNGLEQEYIVGNNNNISVEDYEKIKVFLDNSNFSSILVNLSPTDATIMALKFGFVAENEFSNVAVSRFLGIQEQYVRDVIKNTLSLCKEHLENVSMEDDDKVLGPVKKIGHSK